MDTDRNAVSELTSAAHRLENLAERLFDGLQTRWVAIRQAGGDIAALNATFAEASTSAWTLALQIALTSLVALAVFFMGRKWLSQRSPILSRRGDAVGVLAAAALAGIVGLLMAQMLGSTQLPVRTLRLWALALVFGALIMTALRGILLSTVREEFRDYRLRRARLVRDLTAAIAWAVVGLSLVATLRLWNAGSGLLDLIGTCLVSLPALGLLIVAIYRNRRTVAGAVAGPKPRSRWRQSFSKIWPGIVIAMLVFIVLNGQIALTLGTGLPGLAVLLTVIIVIVAPHLDAVIWEWAERGLRSPKISTAAAAWRQTARLTVAIALFAMLGVVWATPLAAGFDINLAAVTADAAKVALILLVTAYLWNLIGVMVAKAVRQEHRNLQHEADAEIGAPKSRLGTLLPLLGSVGKSIVAILGLLSMMVSIGLNVWPLITGLSFFGLAISFGSQALVKDIVSGLFFLLDDAFRLGEYIETSGANGVVEKISIRSLSLRESRGAISTVPYGNIGAVQNFSRDWAIEKLEFRVAFDTDVELVRKLFRKIGEQIAADPEFAKYLLQPFKSQGIAQVDEGTLLIRAKFMAKPGHQHSIRREALKAVHAAFREHGIKSVSKPLTALAGPAAA